MTDKIETPARPPLGEIAASLPGRDLTREFVGPLALPTDGLLQLKGGGDYEIYRAILTDDQVWTCLQQRFSRVVSLDWDVAPGAEDRASKKAAAFLKGQLDRLDWDMITRQMLLGLFWGHAVAEVVYGSENNYTTIEAIKVRNRERFRFDVDGKPRLLTERVQMFGEETPDQKFWVYSVGLAHDDDPYGIGLAHWLYWPVTFKRRGASVWLQGMDRAATPPMVGKFPTSATPEEQSKLLTLTEAATRSKAIILPESMALEPLGASKSAAGAGGSSMDPEAFAARWDAAISKVILGQTMTTDNGASRSQAEVHDDVAEDITKADADLVCASFSRTVGTWLTRWNFPDAVPPVVSRIFPESLDEIIARDQKLYAMGRRRTEKSALETYGDGYERAEPKATPETGAPPKKDKIALAADPHAHGDAIAAGFEAGGDRWLDAAAALYGPFGRAMDEEAQDMETLRRRLEAAGRASDAGPLARLLGRGLTEAFLVGESGE